MRAVVLNLLLVHLLLLVIVPVMVGGRRRAMSHGGWVPWVVAAVGLLSLLRVSRVRAKRLDGSDAKRLAASYRARFFIGVGVAEAASSFGLVGAFIAGRGWIYPIGAGFTLIGLALVAPTRAELERSQRQIEDRGSSLSLVAALMPEIPFQA